MKHLFILFSILLFSCQSNTFKQNTIAEFVLIQLNPDENPEAVNQEKLAQLITQLSAAAPRAIIIKPILAKAESLLVQSIQASRTPIYGSAAVDNEHGVVVSEEDVFTMSNLLLKRSFSKVIVPADTLISVYKAVGIEAATFRNSGQLESYYVAVALHGKTTASLPFLLTADLLGKKVNDISPVRLFLSTNGTMPVRFSNPDTYPLTTADAVFNNSFPQDSLKDKIVILYQGSERIATLQGAKLKPEITADVINQLINQILE